MIILTRDEIKEYAKKKLLNSEPIKAKKIGNTLAIQGNLGEEIITYEISKITGEEYIEIKAVVELDSQTNEPGWILTKTGSDNKPIINIFGHMNQYIIPDSRFRNIYEPSDEGENLYFKTQVEEFIQVDEDITFDTINGEMVVFKGGYLKVTDLEMIFSISDESFLQTYKIIE